MRAISMLSALCLFTVLSACDVGSGVGYGDDGRLSTQEAMRNFSEVVGRVEPVAEQECRKDAPQLNCDFLIQLDKRRSAPENAYQSLDENGRPVITFTLALITGTENADELAFVLSHEAAHHIRDHLARQRRNAEAGAVVFAGLATLTGGTEADVANAQKLGAAVGARTYSKEFELEADELGTIIAYRAGFNPLIGANYFTRIPDPGDRFLGTHPPNAERIATVKRTARRLGF
ncbi:M48 family metallopeptidase [Albibacillus kandeliae]|uniref:M48 family metallopeptidase n=1 Tax=Albibacillus kandeliae TaxID=2174228 RepID=UPI000D69CD40|nr:M48 family metallopeptidase [Albibacillus kandeliae]